MQEPLLEQEAGAARGQEAVNVGKTGPVANWGAGGMAMSAVVNYKPCRHKTGEDGQSSDETCHPGDLQELGRRRQRRD